jgi:site-specific recombinase XerD
VGFDENVATSFRDYLVETYKPNGAARVWTTAKNYIKSVVGPEGARYFEQVKGPRRVKNVTPRVPSDEDVALLVSRASLNFHDSLVIALLLNGLRASEVGALRKESVEIALNTRDSRQAIVLRVVGKGQKERMVPATIDTQRALNRFRHEARHYLNRSPWLVPNLDDMSQLTYRQVEYAVYKWKVEGMHPHALRHHYATRLVRAGVSLLHVQQLLGHADVSTTQAYVTLDLGDLIEAAQRDPMNVLTEPRLALAV